MLFLKIIIHFFCGVVVIFEFLFPFFIINLVALMGLALIYVIKQYKPYNSKFSPIFQNGFFFPINVLNFFF